MTRHDTPRPWQAGPWVWDRRGEHTAAVGDPVDETTPGAGEMMPVDVVEPDELVIGDCASRNVAKTAPVAVPVRLANTTSAQYYYTACGGRIHTRTTCRGLRNAIQILGSSTHEISGKTACRLCFPVAQSMPAARSREREELAA